VYSKMSMQAINYDIVKNPFFNAFLWFREYQDQTDQYTHADLRISENQYWQPVFERMAHLTSSKYYRFRFGNGKWDKWSVIERRAFDGDSLPKRYISSEFEMEVEKSTDYFTLQYSNPVNKTRKLALLFNTKAQVKVSVEWIFEDTADKRWFTDIARLFREIFSLYKNRNTGPGKSFTSKIQRKYLVPPDEAVLENVKKDPEVFLDDMIRRLFLFLRLRIYSLLEQKNIRINVGATDPFNLFVLKAHQVSGELLPAFSYYFDPEQIEHLQFRNVTSRQIDELQSFEMMKPGEGLCARVAKTKAFQYVSDWRKAFTNKELGLRPSSQEIFELETKIIKGIDLYEWPIIEEGNVKYIVCLTRSKGKILKDEILLRLGQLITREWQKISLALKETTESLKIGFFYKNELARMKGLYNHSFQQRFIAPIKVLLGQIESKDKRFMALKKRISMYQAAVQAVNQNMEMHLSHATKEVFNLGQFLKRDVKQLFDWNKQYMAQAMLVEEYKSMRLKCRIAALVRYINVNKDAFEQALLQVLTNALQVDVFSPTKVEKEPGNCLIEMSLDYQRKGKREFAVITIRNNGKLMEPGILSELQKMFGFIENHGLTMIRSYHYRPITNRKGSNSGTGLLFSAAVMATVNDGRGSGYIRLDNDRNWTRFRIYLPIKSDKQWKG
jgi:hypothetical protein